MLNPLLANEENRPIRRKQEGWTYKVLCVQEAKWKGSKARKMAVGSKLFTME